MNIEYLNYNSEIYNNLRQVLTAKKTNLKLILFISIFCYKYTNTFIVICKKLNFVNIQHFVLRTKKDSTSNYRTNITYLAYLKFVLFN